MRSSQTLGFVLVEQASGLTQDDWQIRFQHIPDYTMIDFGVAVDENIAEGDDPLIFADLLGRCGIGPR